MKGALGEAEHYKNCLSVLNERELAYFGRVARERETVEMLIMEDRRLQRTTLSHWANQVRAIVPHSFLETLSKVG